MIRIKNILIIGLLILISSCGGKTLKEKNREEKIKKIHAETLRKKNKEILFKKKEIERLARRKEMDEEYRIELLRLDRILEEALLISNRYIQKKKFTFKYEKLVDSLYYVKVKIQIGYFFSKHQRHLIIRRTTPSDELSDIFIIKKNSLKHVLAHKQWGLEFVSDTIKDVNGDGGKDFLVNWYGSCGCCLKNFYTLYLYKKNDHSFTKSFEFINPTFSPKEGVIRGIEYGHPGETEMYKYKWNHFTIDTIEYIYPDPKTKGRYIKSKDLNFSDSSHKEIHLIKVPKEYKNIYGYTWFTGEGYD